MARVAGCAPSTSSEHSRGPSAAKPRRRRHALSAGARFGFAMGPQGLSQKPSDSPGTRAICKLSIVMACLTRWEVQGGEWEGSGGAVSACRMEAAAAQGHGGKGARCASATALSIASRLRLESWPLPTTQPSWSGSSTAAGRRLQPSTGCLIKPATSPGRPATPDARAEDKESSREKSGPSLCRVGCDNRAPEFRVSTCRRIAEPTNRNQAAKRRGQVSAENFAACDCRVPHFRVCSCPEIAWVGP